MTNLDRLQKRLADSPYLVLDCESGEASLAAANAMIGHLGGNRFIMDAQEALNKFVGMAGDRDEFSLKDVAATAGIDYHAAHAWMRRGVITPSIREAAGAGTGRGPVFSTTDVFAAGILGTLRRHGLELNVARSVVPLFCETTTKKQTTRKRQTSARS